MNAGGWALSVIVTLLAVGLVVFLIVTLVNSRSDTPPPTPEGHHSQDSAREVLDRRLAAGEIDEDRYRRVRDTLSETPAPTGAAGQPPGARS